MFLISFDFVCIRFILGRVLVKALARYFITSSVVDLQVSLFFLPVVVQE
jgi:hypothetical protein